jgi:hypothetical protein
MPEEKCPPHRYKRKNISRDKNKPYLVFKCVECPSYIRTELAVGITARCYKCNIPLVITAKQASEVAKPICESCVVKTNKTKKIEAEVDNILDKIFNEL